MANRKGRVIIPTDLDVVPQTKEIMERWGADALRDCDGTELPQELKDTGAKSMPPTAPLARTTPGRGKPGRGAADVHYDPVPYGGEGHAAIFYLTDHLYPAMLKVNTYDDIQRWWGSDGPHHRCAGAGRGSGVMMGRAAMW